MDVGKKRTSCTYYHPYTVLNMLLCLSNGRQSICATDALLSNFTTVSIGRVSLLKQLQCCDSLHLHFVRDEPGTTQLCFFYLVDPLVAALPYVVP